MELLIAALLSLTLSGTPDKGTTSDQSGTTVVDDCSRGGSHNTQGGI